jgi:hypothetical protein
MPYDVAREGVQSEESNPTAVKTENRMRIGTSEDEALLVWRDGLLVLDLLLDILDGVLLGLIGSVQRQRQMSEEVSREECRRGGWKGTCDEAKGWDANLAQ